MTAAEYSQLVSLFLGGCCAGAFSMGVLLLGWRS